MYTEENLKKREKCKTHPGVIDATKKVRHGLLLKGKSCSRQSDVMLRCGCYSLLLEQISTLLQWNENGSLSRAAYVKFHTEVANILLPRCSSEEKTELMMVRLADAKKV